MGNGDSGMAFCKILFVELLGGIGDLVIALPAIRALKRSHPLSHLTVLTFAPGGELLEANRWVDRVLYATKGQARQSLEEILEQESFDLIVSDTNYDGIASLIQQSRTKKSITNLWKAPPPNERVGDRFLKILRTEGIVSADSGELDEPLIHITASERENARKMLGALYQPVVVLCPDTGMAIKRWATENFIAVGRALHQQFGASIVVVEGSEQEQSEQLVEAIGEPAKLWHRATLRNLAGMIAETNLVIAPDTGIAHIAAALNIPTLTLFGPSWHERYGHATPHVNFQGYPECPDRLIHNFTEQCCWYSGECPFEWNTCLEDISPATVLEAATTLLQTSTHQTQPKLPFPIPHSPLPPPHNLLVMRLDNIGDVIMTTPALRALRENLPEARITLMASPAGALTAPLLPWVDEVLPWRVLWQDLGRLDFNPAREWKLIETLKSYQFDAAILFTSFSQSPHPPALLCNLAGIPIRLGESKETDTETLTHAIPSAPDTLHQVDRNLRLLESVGFTIVDRRLTLHIPATSQHTAFQLLQNYSSLPLPNSKATFPNSPSAPFPFLLFNPWTSCPSRNYDPNRFVVAVRQLSDMTGYPVVVTGVEKDRDRSRLLLKKLGDRAIDLIGATSLSELVALVAAAKLVLTNNTSTMHIADAVGTPAVILFAGTEMECQWQPRYSLFRLLRRPTVCSPCYAFTCPYELQCLGIEPEQVTAAGLELLEQYDLQNADLQNAVGYSR
jgi:ADP-heptose:LPS heptosyltransferase